MGHYVAIKYGYFKNQYLYRGLYIFPATACPTVNMKGGGAYVLISVSSIISNSKKQRRKGRLTNVHINGYDDLSEYCRTAGYTHRSGKTV